MFSVHSALAVRKQTESIRVNSSSTGPNHLRSRVCCVNDGSSGDGTSGNGSGSYDGCGYIEKMIASYKRMFGELPVPYSSPLERNDHPELDDSKELEA